MVVLGVAAERAAVLFGGIVVVAVLHMHTRSCFCVPVKGLAEAKRIALAFGRHRDASNRGGGRKPLQGTEKWARTEAESLVARWHSSS